MQQVGYVAQRDRADGHRVKRGRVFLEVPNKLVPGSGPPVILLQKPFCQRAEGVERAVYLLSLLRRGIPAQAHLGVQLAGDLARAA